MRTKLLIGLLGAAAVAGLGQAVRADDGKVYPAATCTANNWSTYLSRDGASGSVTVDSQTTLWCPAIGDNENATSSGFKVANIQLFESSNTQDGALTNTRCTLYLYSSSLVLFDSNTGDAAAGWGQRTISIPLSRTGGPQYPRYLIKCYLTGGSTMYEYELEERIP